MYAMDKNNNNNLTDGENIIDRVLSCDIYRNGEITTDQILSFDIPPYVEQQFIRSISLAEWQKAFCLDAYDNKQMVSSQLISIFRLQAAFLSREDVKKCISMTSKPVPIVGFRPVNMYQKLCQEQKILQEVDSLDPEKKIDTRNAKLLIAHRTETFKKFHKLPSSLQPSEYFCQYLLEENFAIPSSRTISLDLLRNLLTASKILS